MEYAESLDDSRSQAGWDKPHVHINRQAVTQNAFDDAHPRSGPSKSMNESVKEYMRSKCDCSPSVLKKKLLLWFPFINLIMTYRRTFIVGDIISGLSVGVVHVPQGMGFALLSAVKPVYGLYSSFFPNIVYFFFGTSRHVSVGTMALISLMVGAVVEREMDLFKNRDVAGITNTTAPTTTNGTFQPNDSSVTQMPRMGLSNEDEEAMRIGIASGVTLLAGLIQIGMGMFNLAGFIIRYMSTPFVGGFTTGAACQIVTSQLGFILGLKLPRHSGALQLPKTYVSIFENITDTNIASLIIGIVSIAFLLIVKEGINERFKSKMKMPIPAELLLVVAGTLVTYFADLNKRYNVKIVGQIEKGFPLPAVPDMSHVQNYVVDAVLIAIISFCISISMAKLYMLKYEYKVDTNQEAFAYGALHTTSSFFHCFAGAVAPPRCTVHESTGGKTQVASLVSCVLLLIVILFIGPYFATLPNSVLASVIIVALLPLFKQFKSLKPLWRVNKWDCAVWVVTWLAVTIIDIVLGLVVGMMFALLTILIQTQLSKTEEVMATDSLDLYATANRTKTTSHPGVKVFRYRGMLCYTNAESFKETIAAEISRFKDEKQKPNGVVVEKEHAPTVFCTPQSIELDDTSPANNDVDKREAPPAGEPHSHHAPDKLTIIVDCAGLSYIDLVGCDTMKQLGKACKRSETALLLAACSAELTAKLSACGFLTDDNKHTVVPTVQDAMVAALDIRNFYASMDTILSRV